MIVYSAPFGHLRRVYHNTNFALSPVSILTESIKSDIQSRISIDSAQCSVPLSLFRYFAFIVIILSSVVHVLNFVLLFYFFLK